MTTPQKVVVIPKQLIDAGAKFILVRGGQKGAFEPQWHEHTYSADDPKLIRHLETGGNYGVVTIDTGVCVIDMDEPAKFSAKGIRIERLFTVGRDGVDTGKKSSYHVYFRCPDCPPELRKKFGTSFGDVRLGGNNYVVGPGSIAPLRTNPEVSRTYEVVFDEPIGDVPFETIQKLLDGKVEPIADETEGTPRVIEKFVMPDVVKQRHYMFKPLVASMVARGNSFAAILAACQAENISKCEIPKPSHVVEKEVADLFDWVTKREVGKAQKRADKAEQRKGHCVPLAGSELTADMLNGIFIHHSNVWLAHVLNERIGMAAEAKYHTIIWDLEKESWMVWDDNEHRWVNEPDGLSIQKHAEELLYSEKEKAKSAGNNGVEDLLKKAQAIANLHGAMEYLKGMCKQHDSIFDADDTVINFPNGTLDIETGVKKDPEPVDYITKVAGVDYNPDAVCPKWEAHVERVIPDAETRRAFQVFMGYCLTAGNSQNAAMFAYGSGKNGKSVTFGVIDGVMGDYAMNSSSATFAERTNDDGPRPDVARMKGVRMVTIPEGKMGKYLDEGLLKNLTGGADNVTARYLYGREFEFKPTGKLIFHTNHLPKIRGRDEGIWRRIYPVPFVVTLPEAVRIPDYDKILLAEEGSGIFNWLYRGYQMYQETERLVYPPEIEAARDLYKDKEDVLGEFLDLYEITKSPSDIILRSDLYTSYKLWAEQDQANGRAYSKSSFNGMMEERIGAPVRHAVHNWIWKGIKLKNKPSTFDGVML